MVAVNYFQVAIFISYNLSNIKISVIISLEIENLC